MDLASFQLVTDDHRYPDLSTPAISRLLTVPEELCSMNTTKIGHLSQDLVNSFFFRIILELGFLEKLSILFHNS